MSNLKTHLVSPDGAACGRVARRVTNDSGRVTCQVCKNQPAYTDLVSVQAVAAAEAFANQEPSQVRNPWAKGTINCIDCGHDLFRSNGRSLDYYNYVCANCGKTNHVITETGMSA